MSNYCHFSIIAYVVIYMAGIKTSPKNTRKHAGSFDAEEDGRLKEVTWADHGAQTPFGGTVTLRRVGPTCPLAPIFWL